MMNSTEAKARLARSHQRIAELEAEVATLQAQLARTWQPVVMGDKPIELPGPFRTVVGMVTPDVLAVIKPGPDNRAQETMLVNLTGDLRLCRLATADD